MVTIKCACGRIFARPPGTVTACPACGQVMTVATGGALLPVAPVPADGPPLAAAADPPAPPDGMIPYASPTTEAERRPAREAKA